LRAVRPRAPAAGPPGPDRAHRMHQRGPLPRHRSALCARPVAVRSEHGRQDGSQHHRRRAQGGRHGGDRGLRGVPAIGPGRGGRASRVRFALDAGVIKDSYVLSYDWDGDDGVRWDLAEPGSVITALSGGYLLADADGGTKVTYDLAVDVRIPMPGMLKRRAEKTIIETALKGLRDRAEAGRGEGTCHGTPAGPARPRSGISSAGSSARGPAA